MSLVFLRKLKPRIIRIPFNKNYCIAACNKETLSEYKTGFAPTRHQFKTSQANRRRKLDEHFISKRKNNKEFITKIFQVKSNDDLSNLFIELHHGYNLINNENNENNIKFKRIRDFDVYHSLFLKALELEYFEFAHNLFTILKEDIISSFNKFSYSDVWLTKLYKYYFNFKIDEAIIKNIPNPSKVIITEFNDLKKLCNTKSNNLPKYFYQNPMLYASLINNLNKGILHACILIHK